MSDRERVMVGERVPLWAIVLLATAGLVGAVVASQLAVEAANASSDPLPSLAAGDATAGESAGDGDTLGDGSDGSGAIDTESESEGGTESQSESESESESDTALQSESESDAESQTEPDSGDTNPAAPGTLDCPPLPVLRFDIASAFPTDGDGLVLSEVVSWMSEHPDAILMVDGHADAAGSEQANLRLSFRRAEAATELLVEAGLDPDRVQARGFGEYQPAPGESPDSVQNRRVTMSVLGRESCPIDQGDQSR